MSNKPFSETDLLFVNEIIKQNDVDVVDEDVSSYRKYKEKKTKQQLPLQQHPVVKKPQYYTVDKIRTVFVDSEFRDTYNYPSPSDFLVTFERTFSNVVKIRLASLEFPNIMPTISAANNVICWINEEDYDLNPPFPVYSVSIAEGSYTISTLQTELQTILSEIPRHNGEIYTSTGKTPVNHNFVVTTDSNTDYIGFSSIDTSATPNNPITATAGSFTIVVNQPGHGYTTGDRIHIIGVIGYVGGISASVLNMTATITVLGDDKFSYQCTMSAMTSQVGGGANVVTGKEFPFQLLFGSYSTDNPSNELGFPISENSSTTISIDNPISSITRQVSQVNINGSIVQFVCKQHGLSVGDQIYVYNFDITPNIYYDRIHNGVFSVENVVSEDVIEISCDVDHISDISQVFIGTRLFHMNFPSHGFNRITEINQAGTGYVQIITLFDHGLNSSSSVLISGTNSVPSIDGAYCGITIPSSDSFIISTSTILTSPGYTGILSSDYDFYLYNVSEFGGFSTSDLNNKKFTVVDIIDEDNFIFKGNYGFSTSIEQGGGDSVRINSKIHGWNGTQSNNLNGKLFRPLRLSGDDYAYMCVPGLMEISESVYNNGPVKNIFAKIKLTANPGMILFDSYYTPPIEIDHVISSLKDMRFQIKSKNNEILDFNGFNYSFTLEITERFLKNKNLKIDLNQKGIYGKV